MNDPAHPSFLERLSALVLREPGDREQLVKLLRSAYARNLLDADAMSIIEGALTVSEMQVRDIMIPRAQVDFIDINEPVETFIARVMATAHSRFPVIDQNKDDVIGVLLAKDLLRHYAGEDEFNVREMLRPAVFVPEAKRLNVLLREFRASRNHMAIVVDEYGGTAGVVTIEDILEEIVGEITDEYDTEEIPPVQTVDEHTVRVAARLPVSDLGELFGAELEPELAEADVDTVGGLLAQRLGRVPLPGAQAEVAGLRLLAEGGKDARGRIRITTVLVSPVDEPPAEEHPAGTGRTTSGSMNRAAERREGSDVAS
jgi:magnesium and cobalt transporter